MPAGYPEATWCIADPISRFRPTSVTREVPDGWRLLETCGRFSSEDRHVRGKTEHPRENGFMRFENIVATGRRVQACGVEDHPPRRSQLDSGRGGTHGIDPRAVWWGRACLPPRSQKSRCCSAERGSRSSSENMARSVVMRGQGRSRSRKPEHCPRRDEGLQFRGATRWHHGSRPARHARLRPVCSAEPHGRIRAIPTRCRTTNRVQRLALLDHAWRSPSRRG
jgi:hypothetical protein